MARNEATTAATTTTEATNPSSAAAEGPSGGADAGADAAKIEHTAIGEFEVSLKGHGVSAQDIEALLRIRALVAD
jgi:hypothetical protein